MYNKKTVLGKVCWGKYVEPFGSKIDEIKGQVLQHDSLMFVVIKN